MAVDGSRRDGGHPVAPTAAAYRMQPFDPIRGLRALAGFAGFGLAVSLVYVTTGFGLGCPLRALTGWECPLCGGTRLGAELLHGHLGAAFGHNPAVFVLLIVLTVLGLAWIAEALGGPKLRPPRVIADRLARVHPTRWLVLAVSLATVYTVLRNLI